MKRYVEIEKVDDQYALRIYEKYGLQEDPYLIQTLWVDQVHDWR